MCIKIQYQQVIKACQEQKRDYFVVALENQAKPNLVAQTIPHCKDSIGHVGGIIKRLQKENVKELVLIGNVRRPSFKDLKPDLYTASMAMP